MENDNRIPKYNRIRAGLNATFTKATTFKVVDANLGLVETYTVETGRDESGDHVFVECLSEEVATGAMVTRMYFPPKVVNAINRQRVALTVRIRRSTGKRIAKERMDRGELPGFMRKRVGA
jgi:hypothetical protein